MSIHASVFKSVVVRLALALTALCAAAHVSAQPTLRVTAANSSSPNAVYDVLFGAHANHPAECGREFIQELSFAGARAEQRERRRRCDRRRYHRRHDRALFRPDRYAYGLLDGGVERGIEYSEARNNPTACRSMPRAICTQSLPLAAQWPASVGATRNADHGSKSDRVRDADPARPAVQPQRSRLPRRDRRGAAGYRRQLRRPIRMPASTQATCWCWCATTISPAAAAAPTAAASTC